MLSVKVGTRLDPREAKSILSKQRILCFFKVYISVKKTNNFDLWWNAKKICAYSINVLTFSTRANLVFTKDY